jgi:hypothetical protein
MGNGTARPLEERRSLRYAANLTLPARFGVADVTIRNLCATGFQIQHGESVPLGDERLLHFIYPPAFDDAHRKLRIPERQPDLYYAEYRCAVVWSRLSRDDTLTVPVYRSGLALNSGNVYPFLLPVLLRELVHPEAGELARKRERVREREQRRGTRAQELSDLVLLARTAAQYLREHPAEQYQWHRRARYALSCRNVPHADNPAHGYPADVVAVWEFLGRMLPLHTVAHALSN